MQRYVEFVINHRKPLFVLLALVNLTALAGALQVDIDPQFTVFAPQDSEHKRLLDELDTVFQGSDELLYLLEFDGEKLSSEQAAALRSFQRFLEGLDGVGHVTGPAPELVPVGKRTIGFEELAQTGLDQLEAYYDRLGRLAPFTREEGKTFGVFTIFFEDGIDVRSLIKQIEQYLRQQRITFYASGNRYMQEKIIDYILRILFFLPPVAFILILIVFRSQMGSTKSALLSVLPAGLSALWTVGLVGWLGETVSIVTVLAPIFTIVIGSADGLHFVSHVQDAHSSGCDRKDSIIQTLRMVGIPMVITTVTSMAGFLSLLAMNTAAIQDLAVFASVGIFLAGVATWCVLPLALTGSMELRKPRRRYGQAMSSGFRRLWGAPALITFVLLLILAFIGWSRVTTEFNQLMFYRPYTDVYRSFEKLLQVNKGSVPVFVYVRTDGSPLSPSRAKRLLEFEEKLANSPYVGKVVSIHDFYAVMNGLMGGSEPSYPADPLRLALINSMVLSQRSHPATSLLNLKQNAVRMLVFPTDLENETLDWISEQTDKFDAGNEDISALATGSPYVMRELNKGMIDNQLRTLLLAFALIWILLFVSLRQLRPSLYSLLPIAATVAILHGFLGLSGIPLNLMTATIFSITIGVGIDYAVHFTSVWVAFKRQGLDAAQAAEEAFSYTARPVLANALGLAVGLSALLLSPLRVHLFVSELMWVSMLTSVLLSLSFLPTLLIGRPSFAPSRKVGSS